jgi:hypothetical protein
MSDLTGGDETQAALYGEQGSPTRILKTKKPAPPEKVLARPTPSEAALAIIEAAQKARE